MNPADRIAKLREIESRLVDYPFPPQIVIETTAHCNQRCAHCHHKDLKRPKGRMDMTLYKKIIDEIAAEAPGTEVWMTFYGEALLLGYRLYYMIEYAKRRGLTNVVLNSNAMLLSREMAEMLIESGLDRFIISTDGFTKETYERIRVGGVFEKVRDNILGMLEVLKSRKLTKPRFEVQFSVMDENEHEWEPFKRYWLAQGAFVKVREKLTWAGDISAPNLPKDTPRIACPWVARASALHWNGDFVTCAVDHEGRGIYGNVRERAIRDIWQNEHRALRRVHFEHRFNELPSLCASCLDWQAVGAKTYDPATGEELRRTPAAAKT